MAKFSVLNGCNPSGMKMLDINTVIKPGDHFDSVSIAMYERVRQIAELYQVKGVQISLEDHKKEVLRLVSEKVELAERANRAEAACAEMKDEKDSDYFRHELNAVTAKADRLQALIAAKDEAFKMMLLDFELYSPSHPISPPMYIPLIKKALSSHGSNWTRPEVVEKLVEALEWCDTIIVVPEMEPKDVYVSIKATIKEALALVKKEEA